MNTVFVDYNTIANRVDLSELKDFGDLCLNGSTVPDEIYLSSEVFTKDNDRKRV